MAQLEIREPDASPRQEAIEPPLVIGRQAGCDLVLLDDSVSRRHARILASGADYVIEDLGSNNGTRVNGEDLRSPRPLAEGDEIQIGGARLVFRSGRAGVEQTILSTCCGRLGSDSGDPQEKLAALLDLIHNLGASLDLDEIFPKVLETAFRIFPQAERGSIWLREGAAGELAVRAASERGGTRCKAPEISQTIAEFVMRDAQAVLSTDASLDQRFSSTDSIMALGTRSLLCAPLLDASETPVGMVHLDTNSAAEPFCPEDLDVLVSVANLAGQTVEHARLVESRLAFERRERDLELARGVQEQFLPGSAPELSGYVLAHRYRPAERVGGDYFDYVELPGGRLAVALGDVAGKGVSAALWMARLCGDVRSGLAAEPDPARVLTALGEQLGREDHAGRFVTLAIAVLDPAAHRVELANAGHLPPLLRRAGAGPEPVGEAVAGPPLGVLPDAVYRSESFAMEPGDALLLFTDGVSEARAVGGELFGFERVQPVLAEADAPAILARLVAEIDAFSVGAGRADDLCAVALSRSGAG